MLFRSAPDAPAREQVPAARASFRWLAMRRFRSGQTHGRLAAEGRSPPALARESLLALAKAVYCLSAALLFIASTSNRNRYVLRGILHVGVIVGLLGVREIRQYGDDAVPEESVEVPVEGKRHAA